MCRLFFLVKKKINVSSEDNIQYILCVEGKCSVIGCVQAVKWSLCTSPAVGLGGSMFQVELIKDQSLGSTNGYSSSPVTPDL